MQIHISSNATELSNTVADWMISIIHEKLKTSDRFTLALSGGSTPQLLHKILAAPGRKEKIDWEKIHFFWGDERAVPFDDERNNAKMAFDTLLDHVPVKKDHIHIMQTDIDPKESAKKYSDILHRYFQQGQPSFDLVLLGMGDDGHTLSLFPETEILHNQPDWTNAFYLEAQKMFRITLSSDIVNYSERIAFLVAGGGKAPALREVLQGDYNPDRYPSQLIKPASGQVHWFVDKAAAAELKLV